jgi:hypothetical protein
MRLVQRELGLSCCGRFGHRPQSIGDYAAQKRVPLVPVVAAVFFRELKTKTVLFENLREPDIRSEQTFPVATRKPNVWDLCGIGSSSEDVWIIFVLESSAVEGNVPHLHGASEAGMIRDWLFVAVAPSE